MDRATFEREYHDRMNDIINASAGMLERRVVSWLEWIDAEPTVAAYIREAEASFDFGPWYDQAVDMDAEIQIGKLFSKDRKTWTAQFMGLMRSFTDEESWHHIAFAHFRTSSGDAFAIADLKRNIVGPFARDLLKDIGPLISDQARSRPTPVAIESIVNIDPPLCGHRRTERKA